MPTSIDKLYSDSRDLLQFLENTRELTHHRVADDAFRKVLVLSSASFFESVLIEALLNYASHKSKDDGCLMAMLKARVFSRQYHTFFQWDPPNAGPFFKLVGAEIGDKLKSDCKEEPLKSSTKAFLELGQLRNELVHQNFATFPFDKTAKEVFDLYSSAFVFVERVLTSLAVDGKVDQPEEEKPGA